MTEREILELLEYIRDATLLYIKRRRYAKSHPKYTLTDCDYVDYQTDINNAEVNDMISSKEAWRLRDLVHEKFGQHPELSDRLCATGNVILIEGNTWNDKTWGMVQASDGTWHGQNLLGRILMEERERQQELKQERKQ